MADLIDTVLEQIEVGDCIVFCNRYRGVSYQFMQVIKKNQRSLVLRELHKLISGNLMVHDCMPSEKDDFATEDTVTVRLRLCGSDVVCLKIKYGYCAFLYDKEKHLDKDGNPYQPDVYDRTKQKLYHGCCD